MSSAVQQPSQNADSSALQPTRAIKSAKSRKAPAIKTAVILSRVEGKPWSHIAKDLGIAVNTAKAIVEESDVDRQLSTAHALSTTLLPKAIQAVEKTLDKGDGILGLNFLKWQLGDSPNSKNGQQNALNAVFQQCQVLIQSAVTPQPQQPTQVSGPVEQKPEPMPPTATAGK